MDGDKGGKTGKDPLGRVVINLADYAADDDKATMSFTVAANKVISSDVGECKMLITLGYGTHLTHYVWRQVQRGKFQQ